MQTDLQRLSSLSRARLVDMRCHDVAEKYDVPIKSDQWRNLWFYKHGKSYMDSLVFSSLYEAIKDVRCVFRIGGDAGEICSEDLSWTFPAKNYSHVIQIPWKTK